MHLSLKLTKLTENTDNGGMDEQNTDKASDTMSLTKYNQTLNGFRVSTIEIKPEY